MFRARAETTIAILAKAPEPGRAKTRLIPLLGAHGAAMFHERMIERTVETACRAEIGRVTLWTTSDARHPVFKDLAERYPISLAQQPDGDLGARMAACIAAESTLLPSTVSEAGCAEEAGTFSSKGNESFTPTLVIGADCPALTPQHLQNAAAALRDGADVVVIPVEDGGYVLIGMHRPHRALFDGMVWSVPTVMAETRRRVRANGLALRELETLWDVDRPEDIARMEREGMELFG